LTQLQYLIRLTIVVVDQQSRLLQYDGVPVLHSMIDGYCNRSFGQRACPSIDCSRVRRRPPPPPVRVPVEPKFW
jgi:hypothetical protein